jgi:hypothetical protein
MAELAYGIVCAVQRPTASHGSLRCFLSRCMVAVDDGRAATLAFDRTERASDALGLHIVRAQALDVREIVLVDAAGDILAGEDGAVERGQRRVELPHGRDEVFERLEDDEIRANLLRDRRVVAVVCDELDARRHVDAVDVRVTGTRIRYSRRVTSAQAHTGWEARN